eukprot:TRINITY_DN6144_c0_g1_i4.p1 TRINITY_DN6144_c0_g1~~TRINITY_DN6144_c0_g1_i4.p1  ORF type:complete len:241 (+),score=-3.63 TRINITY_DN6144_c0_g1_i4:988-1710(+)
MDHCRNDYSQHAIDQCNDLIFKIKNAILYKLLHRLTPPQVTIQISNNELITISIYQIREKLKGKIIPLFQHSTKSMYYYYNLKERISIQEEVETITKLAQDVCMRRMHSSKHARFNQQTQSKNECECKPTNGFKILLENRSQIYLFAYKFTFNYNKITIIEKERLKKTPKRTPEENAQNANHLEHQLQNSHQAQILTPTQTTKDIHGFKPIKISHSFPTILALNQPLIALSKIIKSVLCK